MARGERDGIDEIEGDVTAIRLPFLLLLWQDFIYVNCLFHKYPFYRLVSEHHRACSRRARNQTKGSD